MLDAQIEFHESCESIEILIRLALEMSRLYVRETAMVNYLKGTSNSAAWLVCPTFGKRFRITIVTKTDWDYKSVAIQDPLIIDQCINTN